MRYLHRSPAELEHHHKEAVVGDLQLLICIFTAQTRREDEREGQQGKYCTWGNQILINLFLNIMLKLFNLSGPYFNFNNLMY